MFTRNSAKRARASVLVSSRSMIELLEVRSLFSAGVLEPAITAALPFTASAVAADASVVEAPVFSHARGFYSDDFQLTLSTATADATIRYTLDGSDATATSGQVYTGAPISITTTTVVRAIAIKDGLTGSRQVTHTYLFLADVIQQPANVPGYPNPPLLLSGSTRVNLDYAMDPDVVNSAAYAGKVIPALLAIPTMAVSVPKEEIFDNGFYDTKDVEVPISMEYFDPAHPEQNLQVNAGIEAHGDHAQKRSLRVSFKSKYGAAKPPLQLFKYAPANSDSADPRSDQLVLRAGSNRSWTLDHSANNKTTFTEDEFVRATQLALSGDGLHGSYVHLYINGLYWGLYNMVERPNDGFGETYYGGLKANWFSTNHDGDVKSGDPTRWNYMLDVLSTRDQSDPANYAEFKQYLDIDNFSDYLIGIFYAGVSDWPNNNYWAGGDTSINMPFKFFTWDAEFQFNTSLGLQVGPPPNGAWVHPDFRRGVTSNTSPIARLWYAAVKSPEFIRTFSDRVQRATQGALSDAAAIERFDTLNNFVREAVIAESARWGDSLESIGRPTRTRDVDWVNGVNAIRALLPGNANRLISALRTEGYFPAINAVQFSVSPGAVAPGTLLGLSNPNPAGAIYYTLDGSDPALPGGGIAPGALLYSAASPIQIDAATTVRARIKTSTEWSALSVGAYTLGDPAANQAPVANAGSDRTVTLGDSASLAGSATDDGLPPGSPLTAAWTVISGPGTVSFADATKLQTTATFSATGTYVLQLAVGDGELVDTDTMTVSVQPVGTPTPLPTVIVQGESGTFTGGTYWGSGNKGYFGAGYADFAGQDSTAQWTITRTAAGTADIAFRYANGSGANRPLQLLVNGTAVGVIAFAPTGGWTTYATATLTNVALPAGTVTLKAVATTTTGGANIDQLTITSAGQPTDPGEPGEVDPLTLEAEDAALSGGTVKATNHGGYSGSGFADYAGTGSAVQWVVNQAAGGAATLTLRYANGSTGQRPLIVHVNGVNVGAIAGLPTGSWSTWSTATLAVNLQAGSNTIRVVAGLTGGPNLDRLTITPGSDAPPPTEEAGTISGYAFNDTNADGVQNGTETRGAGKTVFLDTNGNNKLDGGERSAVTDSNGVYSFTNLAAGSYFVRRVFPNGYTYSTPARNLVLSEGQVLSGVTIGSKTV